MEKRGVVTAVRLRGLSEGAPRALFRHTGPRYFQACAWVIVLNGVIVAGFGVVALLLYVDLDAGQVAVFAACLALGFAVESGLGAPDFLRAAAPARAWLRRHGANSPSGLAPQEVVAGLNQLYEVAVPVIERHGGHANKFVGDGLLAVFGAPERHPDHAVRAFAAACEIGRLVREGRGGRLRVGLGVNSGRVVVGTIGGGGRRDFTVIGDTVNTAARVEAATRLTGDDILVTETTLRAMRARPEDFQERPPVPLKGKAETARLHAPRWL